MKSVIRALLTASLLAILCFFSALAIVPVADAAAGTDSDAADTVEIAETTADTIKYTIDELDMTLDIPSDLFVFTRALDSSDPNLAYFGLKKEWVDGLFEEKNIYLNAISEHVLYEIYVSMTTGPEIWDVEDFGACDDAYLQSLIDNSSSLYKDSSKTYSKTEIYKTAQASYIRSYSEFIDKDDDLVYCASCFTITDGMAIDIYLLSYDKPVTPERDAILTGVVDSASLPVTPVSNEPSPEPSAYEPSPAVSPSSNPGEPAEPDQTDAAGQSSDKNQQTVSFLFLIYLGVTLVIVILPVAVYRYIIRKRPVSGKSAVLIALIYGVAVCIAVIIFIYFAKQHYYLIGGVILWNFADYFILSCGRNKPVTPPAPERANKSVRRVKEENAEAPDIIMSKPCKKCLAVNLADSNVCFYCGSKLDDEENQDD